MDLSKFDTRKACDAGAPMIVSYEGVPLFQDDGKPVTITLRGRDSDVFQRSVRSRADSKMQSTQRLVLTTASLEEDSIETLADCTVSWDGIMVDGEYPECNRENAAKLYSRFPWLREQADTFVATRSNFLKPAQKN